MLWGLTIDPANPLKYTVQQDVFVSFAVLDCREGGYAKQLLHLAIQHGGSNRLLCSFIVGYVFHQNLNLRLTAGEEITFIITGPNKVHLNGYTCSGELDAEWCNRPIPLKGARLEAPVDGSGSEAGGSETSHEDRGETEGNADTRETADDQPSATNNGEAPAEEMDSMQTNLEKEIEDGDQATRNSESVENQPPESHEERDADETESQGSEMDSQPLSQLLIKVTKRLEESMAKSGSTVQGNSELAPDEEEYEDTLSMDYSVEFNDDSDKSIEVITLSSGGDDSDDTDEGNDLKKEEEEKSRTKQVDSKMWTTLDSGRKTRNSSKQENVEETEGSPEKSHSTDPTDEPEIIILSTRLHPTTQTPSLGGHRGDCGHEELTGNQTRCGVCKDGPRIRIKAPQPNKKKKQRAAGKHYGGAYLYAKSRSKRVKTSSSSTNRKESSGRVVRGNVPQRVRKPAKETSTVRDESIPRSHSSWPSGNTLGKLHLRKQALPEQERRKRKQNLAKLVKSKYSSKVFKFRKKEVHKTMTEKYTFYKCRYCASSFVSRVARRIHEESHVNDNYGKR